MSRITQIHRLLHTLSAESEGIAVAAGTEVAAGAVDSQSVEGFDIDHRIVVGPEAVVPSNCYYTSWDVADQSKVNAEYGGGVDE